MALTETVSVDRLGVKASLDAAARRHLGFAITDQQWEAAHRLRSGSVVEMLAGEGKTVAVALAAILHALEGRQVHVMTANDYLADRDRWWMMDIYRSAGVSVAAVLENMYADERRSAYSQSVVYGTLKEFAFDHLRDNMLAPGTKPVQSDPDVAIVDEADQTLLDEASTPIIIAGEPVLNSRTIRRAERAVRDLAAMQRGMAEDARHAFASLDKPTRDDAPVMARALMAEPRHDDMRALVSRWPKLKDRAESYWDNGDGLGPDPTATDGLLCAVAPDLSRFSLLPDGVAFLHERLGPIYDNARPDGRRAAVVQQVHQLLIAHLLLRRDVDYLVEEGRVALIDRDTGRLRLESRYRQGLQPAVEAKEGVEIHPDCPTRASTSVPGFVNRYQHVSGITGTAKAGEEEFRSVYNLPVWVVEPSYPRRRSDRPSRLYPSPDDHQLAVLAEVSGAHELGRPVLLATRSVAQSEAMSAVLDHAGIPHRILNAATGLEEHDIISAAGESGAVTVSTNVAGRGSDIVMDDGLDGEIERRFVELLAARMALSGSVVVNGASVAETDRAHGLATLAGFSVLRESGVRFTVCRRGASSRDAADGAAIEFGLGLLVVVSEFNDNERVEQQLRGRAGRNGRYGSTVAVLSNTDPYLMDLKPGTLAVDDAGLSCWMGHDLERKLDRRRGRAGLEARARRSAYLEYASVLDGQTDAFHRLRRQLLGEDPGEVRERLALAAKASGQRLVSTHFPNLSVDRYEERFDAMAEDAAERYGVDVDSLYGESLLLMSDLLADLLTPSLDDSDLSGTVRVEDVDLLWERHQDLLWERAHVSLLTSHGLKTSVAEYIIEARRLWSGFVEGVNERILTRVQ